MQPVDEPDALEALQVLQTFVKARIDPDLARRAPLAREGWMGVPAGRGNGVSMTPIGSRVGRAGMRQPVVRGSDIGVYCTYYHGPDTVKPLRERVTRAGGERIGNHDE